jgi:tetratricopeptide (TPR) repeat protein
VAKKNNLIKTTNMKKYLIVFIALLCTVACSNKITTTKFLPSNEAFVNKNKDTMLIGFCSLAILNAMPQKIWYDTNYAKYKVDTLRANLLQPILENATIEIYLGTWCGDSRREVPRMLKIFELAQVDTNNIKLIFVDDATDTYKQSPQHQEVGKNIHHVPTFIFYSNKKEVGRIVETPIENFERDIATIFAKLPYTPKYKAIEIFNKIKKLDNIIPVEEQQFLAIKYKSITKHWGELNTYAYLLAGQKRYEAAINVLSINMLMYPNNAGLYDSLGEIYLMQGNKILAKENYLKVLDLKPNDENALKMLEKI